MKYAITAFLLICGTMCLGQTSEGDDQFAELRTQLRASQRKIESVRAQAQRNARTISTLTTENAQLQKQVDSLGAVCRGLEQEQCKDRDSVVARFEATAECIEQGQSVVKSRTAYGIGIAALIALALGVVAWLMARKIRRGHSMIDDVRQAQAALQEESVKLDNKLVELLAAQMDAKKPEPVKGKEPDHSLALKVADEIVRIEKNLSHMDSSVRGHKQLSKAVERMRNNFIANGYEIVEMLGKPYNFGMKVTADFTPDDTLPEGAQVITGITKPQVNYNGVMIQAAQITVSQNI